VVFAARPAPVDRASSRPGAPLLTSRRGSRRPLSGRSPGHPRCGAWPRALRGVGATRRPRSTQPGAASTYARPEAELLRQVFPGIPVCRTNRMPWNTSRSGCRFRPGCRALLFVVPDRLQGHMGRRDGRDCVDRAYRITPAYRRNSPPSPPDGNPKGQ
jgi:hypothetical protein